MNLTAYLANTLFVMKSFVLCSTVLFKNPLTIWFFKPSSPNTLACLNSYVKRGENKVWSLVLSK